MSATATRVSPKRTSGRSTWRATTNVRRTSKLARETRQTNCSNIFRWYRSGWGRYTQSDPLGKLGDPNPYAYALDNPIAFADPLGLKVFKCCRDVQVNAVVNAVAQTFNLKHCFIKTDSIEAGLGPANGGPLPGCPLGVQTAIVNHAGQSQEAGTTCTEITNVNETCVNNQLPLGKKMGPWTPANQCNSFVDSVFNKCKNCKPSPTPTAPVNCMMVNGQKVCVGTGI
jgi:RHS repeat-associated protein